MQWVLLNSPYFFLINLYAMWRILFLYSPHLRAASVRIFTLAYESQMDFVPLTQILEEKPNQTKQRTAFN